MGGKEERVRESERARQCRRGRSVMKGLRAIRVPPKAPELSCFCVMQPLSFITAVGGSTDSGPVATKDPIDSETA